MTAGPHDIERDDEPQRKRALRVALLIAGVVISAIAPAAGGLIERSAIRSAASTAAGLGTVVFIFGCIQIAKAKGQPWYYGLLGFVSCIGLAILWWVVPDKNTPTA